MDHSWGYGSEQRLREENQDSFGVFEFPDYTLAVVCDGMGGHVGGAQASSLAVRTIHDTLLELQGRPVQEALEEALQRTNLVIYEAARKNHRLMGMGTTAVVAAITGDACYLAHVGDSRAYLLRKGQVQQLTRDHTMVNLFVDAELLSPEDAATHPEAHVLSRSLGVERQVDVELAEPIPMEAGDVVFLCSDGVHGVVTDWELANVDWGAPHAGIGQVLGIVGTREGDDNATAVAVMMGTSFEDVAPTGIPELRRFDEISPASGVTAVPMDEELAFDTGPSSGRRTPDSGGAGYIVYEDHPVMEPDKGEMVVAPSMQPPAMPQPQQQRAPAKPGDKSDKPAAPPKPTVKRRSPVLPILVASLALLTALGGAVFLLIPGGGMTSTDDEITELIVEDPFEDAPNEVKVATPVPGNPLVAVDPPEPTEPQPEVVPDQPLFKPDLPKGPRRLPHRPQEYTQPPPGGPLQFTAVDAARKRDCPLALEAVQKGMKEVSVDHATLYKGAWFCFNEAHQRRLEQAEAETWADFTYQLPHFEGTPEDQNSVLEAHPELERLPAWFRPAVGGIEYRLEHFSADPQMDEVLVDLFGEPNVADHLAKDIHMEALAAAGLSRIPPEERTPAMEDAWARRVYVTAWALQNRPGRLLDLYRHDLLPDLRQLLDEATTPRLQPEGKPWPVPKVVTEAREVAEGNRPAPTASAAPKVKPINIEDLEPSLGEDDLDINVHRGQTNP